MTQDNKLIEKVAKAINFSIKQQFNATGLSAFPDDHTSWTAAGNSLDLCEVAIAAIAAIKQAERNKACNGQ